MPRSGTDYADEAMGVLTEDTHRVNPFETSDTTEVFVPKEIITSRIQDICTGPNKGRKTDHYLVVWEDYPLKKDYTWEPIEKVYGHEDLVQTYDQCLKTEGGSRQDDGQTIDITKSPACCSPPV